MPIGNAAGGETNRRVCLAMLRPSLKSVSCAVSGKSQFWRCFWKDNLLVCSMFGGAGTSDQYPRTQGGKALPDGRQRRLPVSTDRSISSRSADGCHPSHEDSSHQSVDHCCCYSPSGGLDTDVVMQAYSNVYFHTTLRQRTRQVSCLKLGSNHAVSRLASCKPPCT
jgi:hypothetical protein